MFFLIWYVFIFSIVIGIGTAYKIYNTGTADASRLYKYTDKK